MTRIRRRILQRMGKSPHPGSSSLDFWRVRILFSTLFWSLLIGLAAFFMVFPLLMAENRWGMLTFEFGVWISALLCLTLPGLSLKLRSLATISLVYLVGLITLLCIGPLSSGPVWLFCFAVLTGILLGSKAAFLSVLINTLTLGGIAYLMDQQIWGQAYPFFSSQRIMLASVIHFVFLNGVVALSLSVLVKGLTQSQEKELQTAEALKKSNRRFQVLSEAAVEAILLVKDGICIEANQTATGMFGFNAPSGLVGKKILTLFDADSHRLVSENQDAPSSSFKAIAVHQNGQRFPVAVRNKNMPYENIGDVCVFSLADLTSREKLENINKTLFAISNAVSTTLDLDDLYRQIHLLLSKIIDVTNFFIAIVNKEKRTIKFPYHADEQDDEFTPIMEFDMENSLTGMVVLKRKPILFEYEELEQIFAQKGSWGPPCKVWMGVPLIVKSDVIGVIAVQSYTDPDLYTDQDLEILSSVSDQVAIAIERKQTEDDLRESEKRYRRLLNDAPVGIYEVDYVRQKFNQVNQTMCRYLGYSQEEFLALHPLTILSDDSKNQFHKRHQALLRGETVPENIEYRFVKKNGEIMTVHVKSHFIYDDGNLAGARIVADDITERKKIEEMMIQSEKMMSVGGLAAGMAHEINNPLAGMIQNAQLIENRLTKDLPANDQVASELGTSMAVIRAFMEKRDIVAKLKNINQAGSRAAKIINNMLSFAKKGDSVKMASDLAELMDATVDLARNEYDLKKKYDFKQIQIDRDYQPDMPKVRCEPSKIQQVLFNLLKNAAESMAMDRTPKKASRILLRLRRQGQKACIEIEDNGSGMDPETRKRVFEPFFTTKSVDKGTGLGLSVSYFIVVEDHGGEMKVESELLKGTRFIIRLPI